MGTPSRDTRGVFERLFYPKRRLTWVGLLRAVARDESVARERVILHHQHTSSLQERAAEGRLSRTLQEKDLDRLEARLEGLSELLSRLVETEIGVVEAVAEWRRLVPSKRPIEFVPDLPHAFEQDGKIETVLIPASRGGAS